MNQLENKSKMNKNGNGSHIAGVEMSADNQMAEQSQMDAPQAEQPTRKVRRSGAEHVAGDTDFELFLLLLDPIEMRLGAQI